MLDYQTLACAEKDRRGFTAMTVTVFGADTSATFRFEYLYEKEGLVLNALSERGTGETYTPISDARYDEVCGPLSRIIDAGPSWTRTPIPVH
jgi:hypothetical protein